jgi:hypothetical protein
MENVKPLDPRKRPAVPDAVKRILRQEAAFGCCACGNPILEYHHIIEWSEERHFRPEDMMVLCPLCHNKASKHAFPEKEQRWCKANPFNQRRGLAKGLLSVPQDYAALNCGGAILVNEGPFVIVDGQEVIAMRVESGILYLSLLLNDADGNTLCKVVDNEWTAGDPLAWDIEADWQKLVLRQRPRHISMSLDLKSKPITLLGEFWSNGNSIKITPSALTFRAPGIVDAHLGPAGLAGIPLAYANGRLKMGGGGRGYIVGERDIRQRLYKTVEAWRRAKLYRSAKAP